MATEALKDVECQLVFDLPKGIEHWLTDQEQGFSVGQRQQLSLAHAAPQSQGTILDEAISNLYHDTKMKLIETLTQLKRKMTVITLTHQQALSQLADEQARLDSIA